MRNVLLIARREYLELIRGRAFRLTTILLPVLYIGMLAISYISSHRMTGGRRVVIASGNATLAYDVRALLLAEPNSRYTVEIVAPAGEAERSAQLARVDKKQIDGVLWIASSTDGTAQATYYGRSVNDFLTERELQEAVNRSLLQERLGAQGVNTDQANRILQGVTLQTRQASEANSSEKRESGMLYKGLTMAFLLTMSTLIYGLDAARSVVEEKRTRIFEVMLSVTSADDLLAGKLLGVGAVGLTQIVIWVAAGASIAASALAGPILSGQLHVFLSWMDALLFPAYFLLGFFLYSAFFSGLAATCETAQELQMYMPLAVIPVWLSFGLLPLLLSDPNSGWPLAASFFPLTSPFVMMLRMGMETPPAWQIAVSLALLVVSVRLALWFSSRLYRVGILMYGKRATLPQILHWLRYS